MFFLKLVKRGEASEHNLSYNIELLIFYVIFFSFVLVGVFIMFVILEGEKVLKL